MDCQVKQTGSPGIYRAPESLAFTVLVGGIVAGLALAAGRYDERHRLTPVVLS